MPYPGESDRTADARRRVSALLSAGYAVIPVSEYEYLCDVSSSSLDGSVELEVLPAPSPHPSSGEDPLLDYYDEDLRRVAVLPRSLYERLCRDAYGEYHASFVEPPPYRWLPSPNYTNARRNASNVYYHIVHTTEGSYSGSVNWLRDRRSYASCHPIIDASGTQSAVLVSDEDIAWTAGHSHYNTYGLQIEQEGYASRGGFTEGLYRLSAHWAAHHLTKFQIPVQLGFDPSKPYNAQKGRAYRAGIIGHHHVPYPSIHTDPGPYFDFEKLLFYTRRIIEGEDAPPKPPKKEKGSFRLGRYNVLAKGPRDQEISKCFVNAVREQFPDRKDLSIIRQAFAPEKIRFASENSYNSPAEDKIWAIVIGSPTVDHLYGPAKKLLEKNDRSFSETGHQDCVGKSLEGSARLALECLRNLGRRESLDVERLISSYLSCLESSLGLRIDSSLEGRRGPDDILGLPIAPLDRALEWARENGSHGRFREIIPLYYELAPKAGIAPDVLVAQSALETDFWRYTGKVPPSYHNLAGIKIKNPSPYDIREDHERFPSWREGVRAHINHMCAYTGSKPLGPPEYGKIHDRYYVVKSLPWAGTVKKIDGLSGRWAPRRDYADLLRRRFLDPLCKP